MVIFSQILLLNQYLNTEFVFESRIWIKKKKSSWFFIWKFELVYFSQFFSQFSILKLFVSSRYKLLFNYKKIENSLVIKRFWNFSDSSFVNFPGFKKPSVFKITNFFKNHDQINTRLKLFFFQATIISRVDTAHTDAIVCCLFKKFFFYFLSLSSSFRVFLE